MKKKKTYSSKRFNFDENNHTNYYLIRQTNNKEDISEDNKNFYEVGESKEFPKGHEDSNDNKTNEAQNRSTEETEKEKDNKKNKKEMTITETKDNIHCNEIKNININNYEQKKDYNEDFQKEIDKLKTYIFKKSSIFKNKCPLFIHEPIKCDFMSDDKLDSDDIFLMKKRFLEEYINSDGDMNSDEEINNDNDDNNDNNDNTDNNDNDDNNDNNDNNDKKQYHNIIFKIEKEKKNNFNVELTLYNYNTFIENYSEIKKNIKGYNKDLITLKEISKYKEVAKQLINKGIFKNESELYENEEKWENYNKILYYLTYNKNKKEKKKENENENENKNKERNLDHDEMSNRIKTGLFQAILEILNSFDEMKNNPIGKLSKDIIYTHTKADFNLGIFIQNVCSIFANHSNQGDNYRNICRIIDEYNEKKEHESLYEFLYFIIQDCFDIYRYIKKDSKKLFKTKFGDYLIKVYKDLNFETDEKKKDYIVSFILLTYNLESYYANKPIRNIKKRHFI